MKTLTLTSNGLTGSQWIARLKKKKYNIGTYAKQVLNSPDFKLSKKGTKHDIVIYKLEDLTTASYLESSNIRKFAQEKGAKVPNAEIACLLREAMTDKEIEDMDLWWIAVFHEPINDSGGDPRLLGVGRRGDGRWLRAADVRPYDRWFRGDGFVFLAPQVSPKKLDIEHSELGTLGFAIETVKKAGYQVSKIL